MIHRDPEPNPQWWHTPVLALMVFAALAFASEQDYQAAEREHRVYCEFVENQTWPDYKGLHERGECND